MTITDIPTQRPVAPGPISAPTLPERQAAAVEEVRAMHQTIQDQNGAIGHLRTELNRAEDRVTLLLDERNRFRKEANIYRTKLVELATAMANVGLLTNQAQSIMTSAHELIERVDGHNDETEHTQSNKDKIDGVVANLAGELK